MAITIQGTELVFSNQYTGPIFMQKQEFHGGPCRKQRIGTAKLGMQNLTLPNDLEKGLYCIYCGNEVIQNDLYYGKKPRVEWTVNQYTKFDNQQVWRHKLNFSGIPVRLGEDFFLTRGVVEFSAGSTRESSFDFLCFLPRDKLKIRLSDELKAFIDEPK